MNFQEELSLPFPLRPYQEEGVEFLTSNNSALLGDDMGLGKTVQTIVALKKLYKKTGGYRCLIVVPNAVATNWVREFNIWFPEVHIERVEGNADKRRYQFVMNQGFLICTYEQTRSMFITTNNYLHYDLVIFDESHRLKNKKSQLHQASSMIKKNKCWMLSGTPLENNEEELINIFDILGKNVLNTSMSNKEISNKLSNYMLRRRKEEVLKDLPELIEQDVYIDMTKKQREEYETIYSGRNQLNLNDSGSIFSLITKLKLACNFSPESSESGKLEYLENLLEEHQKNSRKVIVFSQYVKTLEYLQNYFNFESQIYHGGQDTSKKDMVINTFKEKQGFDVLFMSLKAGSVGLNLQEASTVVLYDRWWNPAIESQAISRAHRMGNKQDNVLAIKLITSNSIEERINELIHEKKELFKEVVDEAVIVRNKKSLLSLLDLENKEKNL